MVQAGQGAGLAEKLCASLGERLGTQTKRQLGLFDGAHAAG